MPRPEKIPASANAPMRLDAARQEIETHLVAWLDGIGLTTMQIFGEWYVELKDRRHSISEIAEAIGEKTCAMSR